MTRSPHDRIRGIEHVGVTVPDIEAGTRFLRAAFGAEIVYDTVVDGTPRRSPEQTAATVALPNDKKIVATRVLRIGDGASIELFEVRGADPAPTGLGTFGVHHFSVLCDDLEAVRAQVLAAGGEQLEGPNALFGPEEGPGNRMHYVRAPWGTLIELIAFPSPTQRGLEAERWTPAPQSSLYRDDR